VQNCNGRDGSILLGELAQIITAMRNRAIQPPTWTALYGSYDNFNRSLYYMFVRSKKREQVQPFESELRFKCDLTIMAYRNGLSQPLRDESSTYPGVNEMYDAIAPFLSVEFKATASPADSREAIH
jgi:hypothetical protein